MLASRQLALLDFPTACSAGGVAPGHRGGERGTGGICRDSSSSASSSVWQWHTDRVHLWGPDIASGGGVGGFQAACGVGGLLSVRIFSSPLSGGSSAHLPFWLSTKPADPSTGNYYDGYRWSNALTGRWNGRDPIGEEGGVNLYGFVENEWGNCCFFRLV